MMKTKDVRVSRYIRRTNKINSISFQKSSKIKPILGDVYLFVDTISKIVCEIANREKPDSCKQKYG